MKVPWGLALRHIFEHWFRNLLTVLAVGVAVFLFCFLVSLIVTLDDQVEEASQDRVIVQSAVSLFVTLPLDYLAKIAAVPGVGDVTKWQWFGAYFQNQSEGFFAQFGVDPDPFFRMYERDIRIIEGPNGETAPAAREAVHLAMLEEKRGALIGQALAKKFGWKVGEAIPLTCTLFPRTDGGAWDFVVLGIYEKQRANVDDSTLFFRFDYLEDTLRNGGATGPLGSGTFFVQVAPDHETAEVIETIDALFTNGPQRTKTSTEAAFQASFVSMLGNLPLFLGTIGGAVVFAVFFSVVNTMMISGRQRIRESGILKALGFPNLTLGALIVYESVLLSSLGGLVGIGLAFGAARGVRQKMANFFPNFAVGPETMAIGFGIAAGIGVIAGVTPMVHLMRTKPTDAMRSEG